MNVDPEGERTFRRPGMRSARVPEAARRRGSPLPCSPTVGKYITPQKTPLGGSGSGINILGTLSSASADSSETTIGRRLPAGPEQNTNQPASWNSVARGFPIGSTSM